MRWEQRVKHSARTDVGLRRKNNEDAHLAQPATDVEGFESHGHVFVVADGMGGHAVGELASKIAVETVSHLLTKDTRPSPEALRDAIVAANTAIYDRGQHNRDFERMGTTCTSLILGRHGAFVGHVGDSRAYRVRRDRVDQLTFDHSLEWEYRTRYPGRKDDSFLRSHKNVITRSLGPEEQVRVDIEGPFPVFPGDRFLVCSDGLTGLVTDEEIGAVVRLLPVDAATRLLIDLANLRGGNDNCTVVIVEVGELPNGVDPATATLDLMQPTAPSWSLGWVWTVGYLVAMFFLTVGIGMWFSSKPLPGAIMIGLGGAVLIPLVVGTMRTRDEQIKEAASELSDASRTIHNRPHATAVALAPNELARDLSSANMELARTAHEDQWPVDWTKHQQATDEATEAIGGKRFAVAIDAYGRAIHELMIGLNLARSGATAS